MRSKTGKKVRVGGKMKRKSIFAATPGHSKIVIAGHTHKVIH